VFLLFVFVPAFRSSYLSNPAGVTIPNPGSTPWFEEYFDQWDWQTFEKCRHERFVSRFFGSNSCSIFSNFTATLVLVDNYFLVVWQFSDCSGVLDLFFQLFILIFNFETKTSQFL